MQFERLSQFAYHMVDTPTKKNEQYHQGLSLTLQEKTAVYVSKPFEALVGLATQMENIGKEKMKMFTTRFPARNVQGSRPPTNFQRNNKRRWNGEKKPHYPQHQNPTAHSSTLDHRRHLRKDPQLPQKETMIGVLTMEFQGILLEIAEHLRPIAAQRQFVSTVEIEVT